MGKNGAGKSTLLKMVAGSVAPDAGDVKLGASLKMGYFAQQSLDLLDPDLTIEEQLEKDFPHESIGALRNLAGAFQFSGDDIDKKIRALSGGEKTRLVLARMLLEPAELPGARRADQPPRSGDQGDAARRAEGLRRHDAVRVPVAYITQTTLSVDDTKDIIAALQAAIYRYSRPGHPGYLLCDTEPPICGKGPEQAGGRHPGGGGRQ